MEKVSASISIYQGDGSDAKLAHEHYAQLAMATQTECGAHFIAPAEEVFAKNRRDEGEKEKQAEALMKARDELLGIFEQEEVGKVLGSNKRRKMCLDLVRDLMKKNIEDLRAAEKPASLFEVSTIAQELRGSLSEGNLGQYIAMQKIETEERKRELRAAAIIRESFGRHFREQVEGELNCMYATADIREVIRIFMATKLHRMDDGAKIRIKERIANLDAKRTVVQGVDAVVRLYKALEIAADHVGTAEKKAILLNAIGRTIGERSREIASQLPLRHAMKTEPDGDYSYDSIVAAVNRSRNTEYIFPLKDIGSSVAFAMKAGEPEKGTPTPIPGDPTSGKSRNIVPEFEPQITDNIRKWDKGAICGYHYRLKNYPTEPKGAHTNAQCKRDKSLYFEKQYRELIEKLNKGN